MNIAVITGASSGLGMEYARQVATLSEIEEIWLIARSTEKLNQLAYSLSGKACRCLTLDLQKAECYEEYQKQLTAAKPNIRLLINNAGFGKIGKVFDADSAEQAGMIDVNCRALTVITTLSLPYMSKGSGILNVSSIASFAPTPRMTVYSATKAYVAAFSKALREELRSRKIQVLTVCPGPMATPFLETANIIGSHSPAFENLPYCQPQQVATRSLHRLLRGKGFYTNRFIYKFYRVIAKIFPHNWVMKFSKT
ncbi:MAG: SDR family NAD(P)-dependent oxidoreductase [Clostridia bacterium]|nr:SDR family NAD(P)-dependent oxidoreductase [Clostridia bacterium]